MKKIKIVLLSITLICLCLVIPSSAQAQYWQALPPYNLLWPLWSPVLSPPDPVTGIATPLITELSSSTILPVQPALAMDPQLYIGPMGLVPPLLFYNGPTGLLFFSSVYGLNPWPPPSYLDAIGNPVPLTLLPGYSLYPLPLLIDVGVPFLVELANSTFQFAYGNALGIDPATLLTAAQIWGVSPI